MGREKGKGARQGPGKVFDAGSSEVGFIGADALSRLLPSKSRVYKDHG